MTGGAQPLPAALGEETGAASVGARCRNDIVDGNVTVIDAYQHQYDDDNDDVDDYQQKS